MRIETGYFLTQQEIDDVHDFMRRARKAIRFCNEDIAPAKCITCDKRQVRYAFDQIEKIIGKDRFDGEGRLIDNKHI